MHYHPYFDVKDKVALITGGGGGLGRAMAMALAENGASVHLVDRDGEQLAAAAAAFKNHGLSCATHILDVTDLAATRDVVSAIAGPSGRLDIAIAAAGLSAGPGPFTQQGEITAIDESRWQAVLDVNLTGVLNTIRAAADPMIARQSGHIVAIASDAALRANPMTGYAYVASKAGVANIVRQAAIDLARHDIRVNAIAPGPFETGFGGGRLRESETQARFAERIPLKRIGSVDEIRGLTLLLCSGAASFITGAVMSIDGGVTAS
ncbi:SDR family oxidoreductase [Martelella sp. FLE1502]